MTKARAAHHRPGPETPYRQAALNVDGSGPSRRSSLSALIAARSSVSCAGIFSWAMS